MADKRLAEVIRDGRFELIPAVQTCFAQLGKVTSVAVGLRQRRRVPFVEVWNPSCLRLPDWSVRRGDARRERMTPATRNAARVVCEAFAIGTTGG